MTIEAFWKQERNVETDSRFITTFIDINENSKPSVFLILLLLETPTYLFRFFKQKHKLGWTRILFLEIFLGLTG